MSDTPPPLLAVNNIEVIYDHVILVLKGVSLAVPLGSTVALRQGQSTSRRTTYPPIRTERNHG